MAFAITSSAFNYGEKSPQYTHVVKGTDLFFREVIQWFSHAPREGIGRGYQS